jgi:very-short-patch-repair endonuclease
MLSKRVKNMQRVGKIACERKRLMKLNPTKSEKILRDFLKEFKIPHNFQRIVFTNKMFYIIDFVINMKPRTIIEVDGYSHIGREEYDNKRIQEILGLSPFKRWQWQVVRIKNEDVLNGKAFEIIKNIYKKRRHF